MAAKPRGNEKAGGHWHAVPKGLLVLALLGPTEAMGASVQIEDQTGCLQGAELSTAINGVLSGYEGGEEGSITVVGNPGDVGVVTTLRVVTVTGEIVLERRFDLQSQDCPTSTPLISTVLERFLAGFPVEKWEEQPKRTPIPVPREVVVTRNVSTIAGFFLIGVDSRWLPASADLDLGVAADAGSARHRLTGSATLRLGLPHELGGGQYLESFLMLGVGWRYGAETWLSRLEVRVGSLLASGFGYETNHHTWLLWLELQGASLWQVGAVMLGPQVGLTPLRHRIVTADGAVRHTPWLRVGLVCVIPFWMEEV